MRLEVVFTFFIALAIVVLSGNDGFGQTDNASLSEARKWKSSKIDDLELQIQANSNNVELVGELKAQLGWLHEWNPGDMTVKPIASAKELPKVRIEPVINSTVASEIKNELTDEKELSEQRLKSEKSRLAMALADHPDDIGLQQLFLHWLDNPTRRKSNLEQIEQASVLLIKSLNEIQNPSPEIRLATQFAMYRRARALAYRELPDVVKKRPIEDPAKLNAQIVGAYRELVETARKGRSEFILLEIRILRRNKQFGQALSLVEKYGAVIKKQWYLKKRRDLLKELEWGFPNREAAKIYANEFPEEVAKEKLQN